MIRRLPIFFVNLIRSMKIRDYIRVALRRFSEAYLKGTFSFFKGVFGSSMACFFLILWPAGEAEAQSPFQIIPPSPSMQQLQRYADYPTTSFTGVLPISIPIYTIKEGELELPITLNYHASGIKIGDPNGFLGVGWTINFGGYVNATTVGLDDDDIYAGWLKGVHPPSVAYLKTLSEDVSAYGRLRYWEYISKLEMRDLHPDIFSYSCGNYGGKFIFRNWDNKDSVLLLTHNPVDIKFSTQSSRINKFYITLDNGISYTYDGGGREWYLTKIKGAQDTSNQVNIRLQYSSEPCYRRYDTFRMDDGATESEYVRNSVPHPLMDLMPHHKGDVSYDTDESLTANTCASEISFRSGKLVFQYDSDKTTLLKILVQDRLGETVSQMEFVSELIKYDDKQSAHWRKFLKEVRYLDRGGKLINKYTLNYIAPQTKRDWSADTDYWGYYKGVVDENKTLIPNWEMTFYYRANQNQNLFKIGENDRITSEQNMQQYMLNEITYPTGGKTTFEYQANRSKNIQNYGSEVVGGLRLYKLRNYDSNNNEILTKEYRYGTGNGDQSGYGLMDFHPLQKYFTYSERHFIPNGSQLMDMYRRVCVLSKPLINLAPHGSPVVYPSVTEYLSQGGVSMGSVQYEYNYTNLNNTVSFPENNGVEDDSGGFPILYKPYQSLYHDYNDGKLIRKTVLNAAGQIQESSDYTYETREYTYRNGFYFDRYVTYDADPHITEPLHVVYKDPDFYYFHTYYLNYGSPIMWNYADTYIKAVYNQLTGESHSWYGNGNHATRIVNYSYGNTPHDQITRKVENRSNGERVEVNYKYPHDYLGQDAYDKLIARHIWNPIVDKETRVQRGNEFSVEREHTDYSVWNGGLQVLPSQVSSQYNNGALRPRILYQSYDLRGNVQSLSKSQGPATCYLWGYKGSYPVARIENANYADVENVLGGAGIVHDFLSRENPSDAEVRQFLLPLRSGLPGSRVSVYTYKPLVGMTSLEESSGKRTNYEYDSGQRLQAIRDTQGHLKELYEYHYQTQP